MNICMTHYAFYPTTGGVETHLLDLSAELVRQGHTVHALVGSMPPESQEYQIEGIQVHRAEWMNPELMRQRKEAAGYPAEQLWPELLAQIQGAYERFIEDHDIEIVHAHNFHHFMPEYGLALTAIRRERGMPMLLTIHEMWGEFLCHDLLQRTEWDKIIAVGQHVYGDLVAEVQAYENVEVVLHGVNTGMFHPGLTGQSLRDQLGLEGKRVILHPARLLPWKGVHTTVRAFAKIASQFPETVLVITDTQNILDWADELAGYRDKIFDLIQQMGLKDRVVLRSFDFFQELPQAYAVADVVVYPTSGEEPFGLVPLEAMASGTPVVVTRSGGLVESVVDGITGFLIPKEDADQLADRMAALLQRPRLSERMGQAGRKHVMEYFTRSRMARETAQLYEDSVEQAMAAAQGGELALRFSSRLIRKDRTEQ